MLRQNYKKTNKRPARSPNTETTHPVCLSTLTPNKDAQLRDGNLRGNEGLRRDVAAVQGRLTRHGDEQGGGVGGSLPTHGVREDRARGQPGVGADGNLHGLGLLLVAHRLVDENLGDALQGRKQIGVKVPCMFLFTLKTF